MTELTFFQQARVDGGVRTGISIDGNTALTHFEEGSDDFDPALRWFIDITCKGRNLPNEPEAARRWFLDQAPWIKDGLAEAADHVSVGFDNETRPFERVLRGSPAGVQARVIASAMRQVEAREIAAEILQIRRQMLKTLKHLDSIPV